MPRRRIERILRKFDEGGHGFFREIIRKFLLHILLALRNLGRVEPIVNTRGDSVVVRGMDS